MIIFTILALHDVSLDYNPPTKSFSHERKRECNSGRGRQIIILITLYIYMIISQGGARHEELDGDACRGVGDVAAARPAVLHLPELVHARAVRLRRLPPKGI